MKHLLCIAALTGLLLPTPQAAAGTPRPLVALLAPLQAAVAPEPAQWTSVQQPVGIAIPDNWTPGLASDLDAKAVAGGDCRQIYGLTVSTSQAHSRPADLIVTLATVAANGAKLHRTTLFDGPSLASGKTPAEVAAIQLPAKMDASALIDSGSCARFRLNVADMVPGATGTLASWTLSGRIAVYPFAHSPDYYRSLLFGTGTAVPRPQPVVHVAGYFNEMSRGAFTFADAGVFGPTTWRNWMGRSDSQQVDDVVQMLEADGFDFRAFDRNHDDVIDDSELAIVAFTNESRVGGKSRTPVAAGHPECSPTAAGVKVCSHVTFVTEQVNFETLTHEISHSLGTEDLYGDNYVKGECYSFGLTLLSCTLGDTLADHMESLFLDPWHRIRLGWLAPLALTPPVMELGDESWVGFFGQRARPVWIRKPGDDHEYFLFEYRGRRGYDNGVADIGLVVWHVKDNGGDPLGHHIHAVSPNNPRGGSNAWQPADGRFQLQWEDGTLVPWSLSVEPVRRSPNSVALRAERAPEGRRPPSLDIVQPANESSAPYASPVTLRADARDSRGSTKGLRVTWSSDIDGNLGEGATTAASFNAPGKRRISANVRDRFGAAAAASIDFTATNSPPSPTIYSPAADQVLTRNFPFRVLGYAPTPVLFALPCERLTWSIDRAPLWSFIGCDGLANVNVLGPATLTLMAIDDFGASATASVAVRFEDPAPNSPPLVTITAPLSPVLGLGAPVRVSGVAKDPAGGPVTMQWVLSDDVGGREFDLGSSASFDWVPATQMPNGGSMTLLLYGTNSAGLVSRASLHIFIEPPIR